MCLIGIGLANQYNRLSIKINSHTSEWKATVFLHLFLAQLFARSLASTSCILYWRTENSLYSEQRIEIKKRRAVQAAAAAEAKKTFFCVSHINFCYGGVLTRCIKIVVNKIAKVIRCSGSNSSTLFAYRKHKVQVKFIESFRNNKITTRKQQQHHQITRIL